MRLRSKHMTSRVLVVVAVLGVIAAGCSSSSGGSSANKTVKIAYQGALTGGAATLVVPGFNAVKMVFDQAMPGSSAHFP